MQKAVKVQDKYFLRSVHQEIDLLDRKLAHLRKYDVFETEAAREAAAAKMQSARDLLVKTARRLAEEGITFNDSDLPRSFRAMSAGAGPEALQA